MQSKKFPVSFLLTGLLFAMMVSCVTEQPKNDGLFNIDSLIAVQIEFLLAHNAGVHKKASLKKVDKITTNVPANTSDWENELDIFKELDAINKPINKEAYKVESYSDRKSNLKVKSFKTELPLPVKYFRVYYHQSLNQIRKIEALYKESNTLYSSARFLTMEFQNVSDQTLLTAYSIDGGQKMFLDDSVEYKIEVNIILTK